MGQADPAFERLTAVAREYCELIESLGVNVEPATLIGHLNRLLPRLHAAVTVLGDAENAAGFGETVDLDRRFELYSRLRRILGERDPYWMEFDMARDGQEMSGSLADDLTDIYWELKAGLDRLNDETDVAPTLRSWGAGYRLNWGQHLVDAERHLYALRARRVD
jgi:hypothetical protein